MKVDVVVRVTDPDKVELIRTRREDFDSRATKNGVVVSLRSLDGIHYEIPPLLYGHEVRMNLVEGKDTNGLVTVICSVEGEPIRPFWQKGRKNQRTTDREVDARFSLYGAACVITLNKNGLFAITRYEVSVANPGCAELLTNEFFSFLIKRHGGKFVFSESMFASSKTSKAGFWSATKAAIRKANAPDGGGPMYLAEEFEAGDTQEETPQMRVFQMGKKTVVSGGMTMISNQV